MVVLPGFGRRSINSAYKIAQNGDIQVRDWLSKGIYRICEEMTELDLEVIGDKANRYSFEYASDGLDLIRTLFVTGSLYWGLC